MSKQPFPGICIKHELFRIGVHPRGCFNSRSLYGTLVLVSSWSSIARSPAPKLVRNIVVRSGSYSLHLAERVCETPFSINFQDGINSLAARILLTDSLLAACSVRRPAPAGCKTVLLTDSLPAAWSVRLRAARRWLIL